MKVHFYIPSDKMRNIICHSQELVSFGLVWIAHIHLLAASYQHAKLLTVLYVNRNKYLVNSSENTTIVHSLP